MDCRRRFNEPIDFSTLTSAGTRTSQQRKLYESRRDG